MAEKITREGVEAHLKCRLKAHLLVAGERGQPHDYELMLREAREHVRAEATAKLLSRHGHEAPRGHPMTADLLKQGHPLLLDSVFDDADLSLRFDALVRVDGASGLGGFHYQPVLFHEAERPTEGLRLLLGLHGLLLGNVQAKEPAVGLLIHGQGCAERKVKLSGVGEKATRLRELREASKGPPPRLLLNDHCPACEFRQRCHEQAVKEDNLSLLRGIGQREVKALARKGVLTLTQLAHTFRPKRKGKRQERKPGKHFHALKALAIRDKKIYVLGAPQLPESPVEAYLDVEGVPDQGLVYLIGLTVVGGGAEERFSLWADTRGQEEEIFERLLDVLGRHDNFVLFCYGSYEKAFLTRMRRRTERKELADKALKSLVNVLAVVYAHLYFPCHSNGLKDVAGHLGHSWADEGASGLQSLVWRARWEATRDESWKQKLVAYNQDDCAALRRVTELIRGVAARTKQPAGTTEAAAPGLPPIGFVADLDRLAHSIKWGRVNYVHPDYEFINDCAYFDYQRERVFVRTSPRLLKRERKQWRSRNRRLRVSRRVTVRGRSCPSCGSEDLAVVGKGERVECRRPRVKRSFDLVFTASGIRRKVIESRALLQRCLACGKAFVPDEHERLDKYFHGLKCWAVYQHVAHRLSLSTIETMFEDFFGLGVSGPEVYRIKDLMAHFYQPTYRRLLDKILSGGLLHVDETEVHLRSGKAYVWVFTSLEEVVFMYRPNREGDFLKELLKGFKGVLVSDFYAAYDAIDCPQQKCLIHLMRDMNQDLLANPFDEELKSITGPFGTLLRAIVTTIDRHGLRRSHLKRHEPDVEAFFRRVSESSFASEAAAALRTRLLKYQGKLFTFLDHDGVPWNNNNAENAIKRFAYYREDTAGSMTEEGLQDYLVLLSVCHTCRYKRVKFLKFLLSGESDIDTYRAAGRRAKAGAPAKGPFGLEVYPEGFSRAGRPPGEGGPGSGVSNKGGWHQAILTFLSGDPGVGAKFRDVVAHCLRLVGDGRLKTRAPAGDRQRVYQWVARRLIDLKTAGLLSQSNDKTYVITARGLDWLKCQGSQVAHARRPDTPASGAQPESRG